MRRHGVAGRLREAEGALARQEARPQAARRVHPHAADPRGRQEAAARADARRPTPASPRGSPSASERSRMIYAATIFLSSFLLFLVQPLIARQILPWFGGTAAVWTTCMLFFQTLLLAGYAYAHAAEREAAAARARRLLHIGAARARARARCRSRPTRCWKPRAPTEPISAHPAGAHGDRGAALPAARLDQPAAAGLVRARAARRRSVPPVRGVEPRLAAGAGRLSARWSSRSSATASRWSGGPCCSRFLPFSARAWPGLYLQAR